MRVGGKRAGAGRPRGRKNKRTEALEAAMVAAASELPPDMTALQLQQAVYRNDKFPMPVRLKASEAALPYESPRFATIEHRGNQEHPLVGIIERRIIKAGTDAED